MLYLFNTTIMPNEGVFVNRKVSVEEAKAITEKYRSDPYILNGDHSQEFSSIEYTSALGHQGAVDAFNVLGFCNGQVRLNRVQATMKHGDEAICLKVIGRIQEGQILDFAELQKIGFEFYHIQAFAGSWSGETPSSEVHFSVEKNGKMYSDAI